MNDPFFQVEVIARTARPQALVYAALHQDYSEEFVYEELDWDDITEEWAGNIIVNRLLKGDRGHFGCYSDDTEVMTSTGWKLWPDITPDDLLLAVDINSGTACFEKPSALQKLPVTSHDKLYHVSSAFLDLKVTLDHRMVVSHRKKDGTFSDWHFKTAEECYNKPVRYLVNTYLSAQDRRVPSDLPSSTDPLTAFRLAGFFFGDGMRSSNKNPESIRFRLRRPRKIAYLMSLGLPVAQKEGDRYTIKDLELAAWIHKNFSSCTGKIAPNWLITLPPEMIAAFWDGLKNSDGTNIKNKSWCYDSVEKDALDVIQAIAVLNGFYANLMLNNPNEGEGHENHRPCWRLAISERQTYRVEACQKGRSPGVTESLEDYSGFVYCASVSTGALMVRRNGKPVVSGNCLEHPAITLNAGWFPHSTMQQLRTHRVGITFDVQSGRYTGQRIVDVAEGKRSIDEVVYMRPVGTYTDRKGAKYQYTEAERNEDFIWCQEACERYASKISRGFSEEHARATFPFEIRQHWVVTVNARSLMHLLDLRAKRDAELECQQFCELAFPHFKNWMPAIAEWYEENRYGKARLAP